MSVYALGLLSLHTGALASTWEEVIYSPGNFVNSRFATNPNPGIIQNFSSSTTTVPSTSSTLLLFHLVQGTADGLTGGDPAWRSEFATLQEVYFEVTSFFPAFPLPTMRQLVRETYADEKVGSNGFSRLTGSPTSAYRSLGIRQNNSNDQWHEAIPID